MAPRDAEQTGDSPCHSTDILLTDSRRLVCATTPMTNKQLDEFINPLNTGSGSAVIIPRVRPLSDVGTPESAHQNQHTEAAQVQPVGR